MNYYSAPEGKDPQLWRLAHKRASFKRHLATYVVMNIFFWVLWYFTKDDYGYQGSHMVPWPIWPMAGWGIGIVFHYLGAYVTTGSNSVEKEYEKLKNQNK